MHPTMLELAMRYVASCPEAAQELSRRYEERDRLEREKRAKEVDECLASDDILDLIEF